MWLERTLPLWLCRCSKPFTAGNSPWMPHTRLRPFSYSRSTAKFSTIISRIIWLISNITHHCLVTPLVETFSTEPLSSCLQKNLGHSGPFRGSFAKIILFISNSSMTVSGRLLRIREVLSSVVIAKPLSRFTALPFLQDRHCSFLISLSSLSSP